MQEAGQARIPSRGQDSDSSSALKETCYSSESASSAALSILFITVILPQPKRSGNGCARPCPLHAFLIFLLINRKKTFRRPQQRMEMVRLAIAGNSVFRLRY